MPCHGREIRWSTAPPGTFKNKVCISLLTTEVLLFLSQLRTNKVLLQVLPKAASSVQRYLALNTPRFSSLPQDQEFTGHFLHPLLLFLPKKNNVSHTPGKLLAVARSLPISSAPLTFARGSWKVPKIVPVKQTGTCTERSQFRLRLEVKEEPQATCTQDFSAPCFLFSLRESLGLSRQSHWQGFPSDHWGVVNPQLP